MNMRQRIVVVGMLLLALVSCGKKSGAGGGVVASATKEVKMAEGAQLTFSGTKTDLDKVRINVPSQATKKASTLRFTVGLIKDPAPTHTLLLGRMDTMPTAVGPTLRVTPSVSGMTFDRPVEVTIPLNNVAALRKRGLDYNRVAVLVDSNGKKEIVKEGVRLDLYAGTMTVHVTHFSDLTPLAEDGLTDLAKDAIWSFLGTAGEVIDVTDDIVIDPVVTYFTTDDKDKLSAASAKLVEGLVNVAFPTYGLVIKSGKVIIGTASYTVVQLYEAGRSQQMDALLFGSDATNVLGSINNLYRQVPFFTVGAVTNRGITPQNIADKVGSESELRELFFTYYYRTLCDVLMATSPSAKEDILRTLNEAWPRLREYWSKKRDAKKALDGIDKLRKAFEERILAIKKKIDERKQTFKDKSPEKVLEQGDDWVIYVVEDRWLTLNRRESFRQPTAKGSVLWSGTGNAPAKKTLLFPPEGTPASKIFFAAGDALKVMVPDLTDISCEYGAGNWPREFITAKYKGTKYHLKLDGIGTSYNADLNVALLRTVNKNIVPLKKFGKQMLVHATGHGTYDGPRKDDHWMMVPQNSMSKDGKGFVIADGMGGTFSYSCDNVSGPFATNYELVPALRRADKTGPRVGQINLWAEDRSVKIDEIPEGITPTQSGAGGAK